MSRRSSFGLALVAALSAGCHGAPPRTPACSLPDAAPVAFSEPGEALAPSAWWSTFGDADLDGVVAQALEDNPGLAVAAARCGSR